VIGLSKIPRLIVELARRPQIQEGLTQQIAEAFYSKVRPLGVGVEVVARHSCMGCRGAKQPDAEMITSALLGCFRIPEVRVEFFANR
jgi:GTP cyclohydrolase I